jgi:hypothetical protein
MRICRDVHANISRMSTCTDLWIFLQQTTEADVHILEAIRGCQVLTINIIIC